ncbi:hypothetical protein MMC26_000123 [Xylographa opegraphella]|nr:hypothetical protein [Xylographa opegraphella]
MASEFVELALEGANPLIQNYDTIYDKSRETVRKIRIPGKKGQPDKYVNKDGNKPIEEYKYEDYKFTSSRSSNRDRRKDRDEPGSRSAQQAYGYQDSYSNPRDRRPRSGGREPQSAGAAPSGRRDYTPRSARRYESSEESETSIPPRDRRRRNTGGQQDRNAALAGAAAGAGTYGAARAYDGRDTQEDRIARYTPSQVSAQDRPRGEANGYAEKKKKKKKGSDKKEEKKGDEDSDSDSGSESGSGSSSSSVLSSGEDEREHKHIKAKELLSAGLAAVATIHAAAGLYSSMEARDKRYEQLKNGKISPDEARKARTKAKLQDLASVGVAALSIKGAMSEWKGAAEQHKTRKQHKKEKEERHQKRLQKRENAKESSNRSFEQSPPPAYNRKPGNSRPGYNRTYSTSEPDLSRRYYDDSYNYPQTARGPPRYQDANPYAPYGRR